MAHPLTAVPLLWPAIGASKSEAAAIKDLYANLCGLQFNVDAWDAALKLYKFAKNPPESVSRDLARKWRFIACHECVMQLYHLRDRIAMIRENKMRECPTVVSQMDTRALRNAANLFDGYFPGLDELRHAMAHIGTIDTNPAKHAPDGMFGLVGFKDPDDRFSAPYEGVIRSLDITDETLRKINKVVTGVFQAFAPAAQALERLGHSE